MPEPRDPVTVADRLLNLARNHFTFVHTPIGEAFAVDNDGSRLALGRPGSRAGSQRADAFRDRLTGLALDAQLGVVARTHVDRVLTAARHLATAGDEIEADAPRPACTTDAPWEAIGSERPDEPGGPADYSDLAVADRVRDLHGDGLRYCPDTRGWYAYDGQRWLPDGELEALRRVEATVREITEAAPGVREAENLKAQRRLEAVLRNLRHKAGMAVRVTAFNADPLVLNLANGTLDLRTGQLRPFDRADLLTKQVHVAYNPAAACPRWLRFLEQVTRGDPGLTAFLQRALGYSLTGSTKEQVFFFAYGPGANGKSTLLELVLRLLGDYAVSIDPRVILAAGENDHPTAKADLLGARYVVASEPNDGEAWNEGLVKSLTGGEQLRARRMGQDFWRFTPTHTLWFAANHRPSLKSVGKAMRRRVKLLPFTLEVSDENVDRDLDARLWMEREGILAWLVQGCRAWQRDGLGTCAAVEAATDEYFAEMDRVGRFVAERFTAGAPTDRRFWTESTQVWAAWQDWCSEQGLRPYNHPWLLRQLADRSYHCKPKTETRRMHVLGLRPQ